ncbi:mevalonate kinase [Sansalvadorimonas verongulae]|uniref:mevalonate kinase n=1 Tax=Sansalvadorimonas verongulae TaxID=2172824 RepID=UPI0012BD6DD6|nr:mevalonate kinase [Sansalvadorimonas verongulae]MTI13396.1 mevalonate kinase [Sansalvadorimonas verongulae]
MASVSAEEQAVEQPLEKKQSILKSDVVNTVVVSAPGSTMLFGEHAVLHGQAAIACAMDARLSVKATLRSDRKVIIRSALGNYESELDDLEKDQVHRFTLCLLKRWRNRLPGGVELEVASGFSHTVGLGSSAALTVAVAAAFRRLCGLAMKQRALLDECLAVVQEVQGSGSGTDLVASIYGGVVHYRPDTRSVTPLGESLPIVLHYCGYKTPTPDVIARVKAERMYTPSLYDHLFRMMGECTQQAAGAIREGDLARLGRCMNVYHGLMDSLGVCDEALASMVHQLRSQSVLGVKISGSGLGDCVVSLENPEATARSALNDYESLPVSVSTAGVRFESDSQ